MKRKYTIIGVLLLTVSLLGCDRFGSEDNPVESEAKAKIAFDAATKKIVGKWKYVRTNNKSIEALGLQATLEFDKNGKASYDGTIDDGKSIKHKESNYSLENDWKEIEDGGLSGHVYFLLWKGLGKYGRNDRVSCSLTNDEICIADGNEPGLVYVMPPTLYYFKRIE